MDSRLRGNVVPGDGLGHPASGVRFSLNRPGINSMILVAVRLPVCPIPGAEVNRDRQIVCARPLSARPCGHPNYWSPAPTLPPFGSDVGKHAACPYNSEEGPRSPHPPRGPFSTSETLFAPPNSTALATSPGSVGVAPDSTGPALLFDDTTLANGDEFLALGNTKTTLQTSRKCDIMGESMRQAGKAVVACSRG